jgi:vancomycin permeability regulator SanA
MLETKKRPNYFIWLLVSFTRGIAAFFVLYSSLSLLSAAFSGAYNQNAWWIDLSALSLRASLALQILMIVALTYYVVHVPKRLYMRILLAIPPTIIAIFAIFNGIQVWSEASAGTVALGFPVPFSIFIALAFILIAAMILLAGNLAFRTGKNRRFSTIIVMVLSVCLMGFLFPLGQVNCFGTTEYRGNVDAAVVLGAQVYPDGTPSPVLQDRIDTAIDLYNRGLAPVLVMSGGIDIDGTSEAKAMRDYAVDQGVPIYDIVIDEYGSNTQNSAHNTVDTLRAAGLKKVAAVSNFYHLARIKMLYLSEGMDVVTVPAKEIKSSEYPLYNVLREIPGWWYYWFQNLVPNRD